MVLAAAVIFFLLGLPRFLGDDAVARINILQMPIVAQPENALSPDLIVELLDKSGRRVTRSGDSISVKLLVRWFRLKGITTRTTQAGLVRFDNLVPEVTDSASSGPIRLHVSSAAAPRLTVVANIAQGDSLPRLRIQRGRLAGQEVGPGGTVVVRPRQRIQGKLDLYYSAYWGAASVLLVAVPTWGRGPRDAWTVAALATPTIGSTISAPFDFTAPGTPGRYRLVICFEAESAATDIASGTNWTIGHQVWDDGNDVGKWSEEMWKEALAHGRVSTHWLRPSGMHPHTLAATWIEFHVQGITTMP
jgi:hypothetical protein